jgi:hypothetical protein
MGHRWWHRHHLTSPCFARVEVSALINPNAKVEIEADAVLP